MPRTRKNTVKMISKEEGTSFLELHSRLIGEAHENEVAEAFSVLLPRVVSLLRGASLCLRSIYFPHPKCSEER